MRVAPAALELGGTDLEVATAVPAAPLSNVPRPTAAYFSNAFLASA